MKALTICQPWAWAIVHGPKRIENRVWPTDYRGRILIHAGKSKKYWQDPGDWFTAYRFELAVQENLPYGALVGVADLVDCFNRQVLLQRTNYQHYHLLDDPFCEGPWCWLFANVRSFKNPIPCPGNMRVWDVPEIHWGKVKEEMDAIERAST